MICDARCHGTKILFGGRDHAALYGVRQRTRRQKRQECVWTPTVPLSGLWRQPGAASQEPQDGPRTQGGSAPRRGHRTIEFAGRPACLWHGAADHCQVAGKKPRPSRH